MFRLLLIFTVIYLFFFHAYSQSNDVFIDDKGIMRWRDDRSEVQGFGVNYTVPFAHAYRSAIKLNVDHEQAIKDDVYHFARLGFDAFRVHVWDTEISDSLGNLLENEHLKLFDFMLREMQNRGMKFILTPIAFWGNGWPEPDEKTPGFSHKYGKDACLTNEEAIMAQENYLFQFLNHVNTYTGIAYKDDPNIIAFEISNEPHHRESPEKVTAYVTRLVNAMKRTGCEKPVFYNISHGVHLIDAYFDAGVEGGTFQWYPTGLGAQEELGGNLLPNTDRYKITFDQNKRFKAGAKIVYEFDAADVNGSYIYPAMARSFRTAGIQWACHFAYDPTYLAFANTEYNTHYMNLVFTPGKALSLKLAGEVFHQVPLYQDYGSFPDNTKFGSFRISYEEDLAELVTDKKFIYTNHTLTVPPSPKELVEIAGYGNSAVIAYEGTGAYFLDRIDNGVWRLEVMPDAIWLKDPFGRNSLKKTVAVVNWREWPMTITLPDLGNDFSVKPLDQGNIFQPKVQGSAFAIRPGTYMLTEAGAESKINPGEKWKNMRLEEFTAPGTTLKESYLLHNPPTQISSGNPYLITASYVSQYEPDSIELTVAGGFPPKRYEMIRKSGYTYSFEVPEDVIDEGYLKYFITVHGTGNSRTYPGGYDQVPSDWDFDWDESYEVPVVSEEAPIYLFNAFTDEDELYRKWTWESAVTPLTEPGRSEVQVRINKLFEVDPENPEREPIHDYSMRYYFGRKIAGRKQDLDKTSQIVFRGKALTEGSSAFQVALVSKDGRAFGAIIELDSIQQDYRIPFEDLSRVPLVTLPRPYPTFLPYYFEGGSDAPFDIKDMETLQFSIGPGIPENRVDQKQGVAIETIRLE